jgi:hypothetical protein
MLCFVICILGIFYIVYYVNFCSEFRAWKDKRYGLVCWLDIVLETPKFFFVHSKDHLVLCMICLHL